MFHFAAWRCFYRSYSILLCGALLALSRIASGADSGSSVVLVYNRNLPESKQVAEYYAQRRQVPAGQIFGLDLPKTETMTRGEDQQRLSEPLLRHLRESNLLVYPKGGKRHEKSTNEFPVQASIRYAVLCYGVPLKIVNDPKLNEPGVDKVRPELRRNDAAVDSELSMLPNLLSRYHLTGPVVNRLFATTNAALLSPTNGILLVARLDGPTPEIARGLVDKAIQAENDGLWGRAYFDSRGFTNSNYKIGDDWMRGGAQLTARLGFDTVLDNDPATFPVAFPMSQIAIYAGWYIATRPARSPGRRLSLCRALLRITCTRSARRRFARPALIGSGRCWPKVRRPRWVAWKSLTWKARRTFSPFSSAGCIKRSALGKRPMPARTRSRGKPPSSETRYTGRSPRHPLNGTWTCNGVTAN